MNALVRELKRWLGMAGGAGSTGVQAAGSSEQAREARVAQRLAAVDEPFRTALLSMYAAEPQRGSDGGLHAIDASTRIAPGEGSWMHQLVIDHKPGAVLEVGMAYGFSSLYFLAALARNGRGTLTSIDPFQHSVWKGIGATHAMAHAPNWAEGSAFRLLVERSDRAIVDLLREDRRFDLIFIDGNHRFDDVLVDFYLSDQVCAVDGHIVLDDMWMNSIKSVAEFIRTNRTNYQEVPTGRKKTAMFRKIKSDDRPWHHFKPFQVASGV